MKKTAILTLSLGLAALTVLIAGPHFGLELMEDVRGLLMALAGGLTGLAGGAMLPQAK